MKVIKLGLIGLGTIGTGVAQTLLANKELIAKRAGAELVLKKIADLDIEKHREAGVDRALLTEDAYTILDDDEIDIVIELIGGCDDARKYIVHALEHDKHVVTANKALLAEYGKEIFGTASRCGKDLYYEASVGGGIPVIKAIREGLVGNRIQSIFGIINGTANFILSKMTNEGIPFDTALRDAQSRGYAEVDPVFDISGVDSAHKLAILASLASGSLIDFGSIYVDGIENLTPNDIVYAREFGYVIKLLAIYKESDADIEVRVHPTLIPDDTMLASVQGVYNAIFVEGDPVGKTLFYGKGAGRFPTASAVVSDIVDASRNILKGIEERVASFSFDGTGRRVKKINEIMSKYYLRFSVIDEPGVLAKIAGILGKKGISIASVIQKKRKAGDVVPLVLMAHKSLEASINKAIKEIDTMGAVREKTMMIRVEGEDE